MPKRPTNAELIDAIDLWKSEAYVVIGDLLHALDALGSPEGQRALDYFSSFDIFPDGSILPFDITKQEAA